MPVVSRRRRVLEVLSDRPGVTPAEIAAASGVQRTVVYSVLRRLQADGQAQPSPLPSGSAGWKLATAEQGRPTRKQARPAPSPTQPSTAAERPAESRHAAERAAANSGETPAAEDASGDRR